MRGMNMRITERAKSEFEFYRDNSLDMIGHEIGSELLPDANGHSALECWWSFDTHGKELPCREPEVLAKVIRTKKSVNLQVKMWAEDLADGMLLRQSELVGYVHGWPEWVLRAVVEQAGKIATATIGFAPRFARAEYLFGSLWLPEMDLFDPEI
jgi:hypothetical protein